MITRVKALYIHSTLIDLFGGASPIRDNILLESALMRPYQTFDAMDLHRTAITKAAALIESILINHPFIDGNKRTGYVLLRLLLLGQGFDIYASLDEKYAFVIAIASGKLKYDGIMEWLEIYAKRQSDLTA